MAVGVDMATLTTIERIEAAAPKHHCKICTDPLLGPKFESLFLFSGRSAQWCAEDVGIDKKTGQAHVLAKGLRKRRYADQSANVDAFLELCEEALASNEVQITSHAYVNALRLKVDIAQAQLKSHPGVILFLGLPKAIQDALTDVMRAASTSDEALAALSSPQDVGAGTIEEAEEPPASVETANMAGHGSTIEGSGGLGRAAEPKGSKQAEAKSEFEFGSIDNEEAKP